jgi:hypothetical protein
MEHLPQEEGNLNSIIDCSTYHQPSGLSPEAENREHLHPDYYTDLAKGNTKAFVDTYIKGLYAPSQAGKPVYANSFKPEKHVSPVPLEIDPFLPVLIGFDTGLTPAMSFKQYGLDGRIRVLRDISAFDMGMERCIKTYVQPMVRNYFPLNPLVFIGDPAATRRGDGDETSALKELKKAFADVGGTVKTAHTNDPKVRIQASEQMFVRFPEGEPLYLIDPSCKRLIEGYRSKYRYPKIRSTGGFSDQPQKTGEAGTFSHIVEADQYSNMYILSGKYDASDFLRVTNNGSGFTARPAYRPAQLEGY